ncbi:uncharacterized protein METZ01_LOCUS277790, partial [marine metagenome]
MGAVRFQIIDGKLKVLDTFQSFVNPHRAIPYFVQKLTGITDVMVRDAPDIIDLKEKFFSFVGDNPIVGQNIKFDLGFLS